MRILKIIVLVMTALFNVAGYAASFDCTRAETVTEHKICHQLNLNDADVKMATSYNILKRLVPMGTRSVIQDEQVKWLRLRDQCRDNLRCLTDVYAMRQQRLDLYLQQIYQRGPY
ncbi:lysozyme inhibitor LprI family protein [Acinetobacter sp. ANC 4178]|jgi:uncharacterized protein|uniref:lysozyme inhibitor LprI family protein n=1 Tax=Acinetobacter sp. ANC 4178 TaxID=2529839 RepID=UPI00103F3118|nr:lysozyme inhibitor LprI family protein [Acinetobacter sp. ANC 4178]TCB67873.1 hypothetical protein E0H87_06765 [Acinetobacter sp. ANC 4178]